MSKQNILIKKYSNRRLYNTSKSVYITLDDLRKYIEENNSITVIDVTTEEDITNSVLLQIILEQENKGIKLIPKESLEQIIRFHQHEVAKTFADYLNYSISQFEKNYKNFDDILHKINPFYNFIKNFNNKEGD